MNNFLEEQNSTELKREQIRPEAVFLAMLGTSSFPARNELVHS